MRPDPDQPSPNEQMVRRDATASFRHFHSSKVGKPFIVAQLGQSLDGRIATVTGDSRYIGGPDSLRHLHAMRAHVDAVLVGIGTVLADNPQLNVRLVSGKNPARIVLDARGRLPLDAKCLAGGDGARRIVMVAEGAAARDYPAGVEALALPVNAAGHFDLAGLPAILAALGFVRVLIEGGARIISQAVDAGIVDRLHLMVSPVIIGSGQNGLDLKPIELLKDARRPGTAVTLLGGGEVLFDCDLG